MEKHRLLAMTDGVVAIIITIMVLELKIPDQPTLAALASDWPVLLSYVLSFVYVGIYWNNHHHYFHLVRSVNGAVLWANFHLLFWLSLVPFATAWMGATHFAPLPVGIYGAALIAPAIAFRIMQAAVIGADGGAAHSRLAQVLGRDFKGTVSPILYAAGIALAFFSVWASLACYAAVAVIWVVPDRRIEAVSGHPPAGG